VAQRGVRRVDQVEIGALPVRHLPPVYRGLPRIAATVCGGSQSRQGDGKRHARFIEGLGRDVTGADLLVAGAACLAMAPAQVS
jgi:hypothetical protein